MKLVIAEKPSVAQSIAAALGVDIPKQNHSPPADVPPRCRGCPYSGQSPVYRVLYQKDKRRKRAGTLKDGRKFHIYVL